MLGGVFFFSNFSPIEIIVFNKKFSYSIEDIDFLSSNLEKCFTYNYFLYGSGGLKIAELAMVGTKLCAF